MTTLALTLLPVVDGLHRIRRPFLPLGGARIYLLLAVVVIVLVIALVNRRNNR